MTRENLEQRLERKREELRLSSINIQATKIDSWNDDSYFKKHLSNVETEIVLPKVSKNINFNIHIGDNGRLILSPGSEFHFLKDNSLKCGGLLVANGEKNNEIIFTTQNNVNALRFSDSKHDSILKHVIVKGITDYNRKLEVSAGLMVIDSGIDIEHCQVYNHAGGYQGGICISCSRFNISNTYIHHNEALCGGGGIFIYESEGHFNDNRIYENSASIGGGLMIHGSHINMDRNLIKHNYALQKRESIEKGRPANVDDFGELWNWDLDNFSNMWDSNFNGGGMYIYDSLIYGDDNIIEFNRADSVGGGIYIEKTSYGYDGKCVFLGKSNKVRLNIAKEYGGIFKENNPEIDCEVYKNSPE